MQLSVSLATLFDYELRITNYELERSAMTSWRAIDRFEKYTQIKALLDEGCDTFQAATRAEVHPATVRKVRKMSDIELAGYSYKNLLTIRERQVGAYLVQGFDNIYIARILNLSVRTVEHHISIIYNRLNITEKESVHKRVYAANALREIL